MKLVINGRNKRLTDGGGGKQVKRRNCAANSRWVHLLLILSVRYLYVSVHIPSNWLLTVVSDNK